jgi:hypothetical protein
LKLKKDHKARSDLPEDLDPEKEVQMDEEVKTNADEKSAAESDES